VELLKELHILTRDGRLNQDSRRKLKQVNHLYQFIEPLLQELSADGHAPTLADHGAGKSYLGFILYDLFFRRWGAGTSMASNRARTSWSARANWLSDWDLRACRSLTSPSRRPLNRRHCPPA
jgi:hypothetical protein